MSQRITRGIRDVSFIFALLIAVVSRSAPLSDDVMKKDDLANEVDEKSGKRLSAEIDSSIGANNWINTIVEDLDSISMRSTFGGSAGSVVDVNVADTQVVTDAIAPEHSAIHGSNCTRTLGDTWFELHQNTRRYMVRIAPEHSAIHGSNCTRTLGDTWYELHQNTRRYMVRIAPEHSAIHGTNCTRTLGDTWFELHQNTRRYMVRIAPEHSAIHGTNSSDGSKTVAPKYMLELYNKFSTDKYSHPMANIVRSFTNVVDTEALNTTNRMTSQDNRTREHSLVFNVTSVGRDEDIYLAELRLLTLVESDRISFEGINRRVTVYEMTSSDWTDTDGVDFTRDLIASKVIIGRESGWETFTVTDAVRRWVRSRAIMQVLEVRIETVEARDDEATHHHSNHLQQQQLHQLPGIDVDTRPHGENEPLLLIFSNDRRRRKFDSRDLHEMIEHEMDGVEDSVELDSDDTADLDADDYDETDEIDDAPDLQLLDGVTDQQSPRQPADDDDRLLRVRRDTDWSSKNSNDVTSDQHHQHDDDQPPEDSTDYVNRDEDDDPDESVATSQSHHNSAHESGHASLTRPRAQQQQQSVVKKRVRRAKKRRAKRNLCRRKPMYVNFEDIHWDKWIIEPKGYQAYECTGRCYFPLSDHLTPTKHAIVQTILNTNHPRKAQRTCCVPTRLDPISILYIDDQGTFTYKYKYDGMVVAECGCR